jgi:predicted acylesterase/phospholipase RssA
VQDGKVVRELGRLLAVALVGLVLAGCATIDMRDAVPTAALVENAQLPNIVGGRSWGDEVPVDVRAEYKKRFPNLKMIGSEATIARGRRQIEILALSGGGSDGAFGAGVLTGWTERGDRPEFELVTGVSAGAIIAPFAYLGPAYDRQLREIWTEYETKQLLTAQVIPGLLGGSALTDNSKFREVIAKYVDREFLRKIAAQYKRGRVLSVGTTNLDAKRPVVWNMGEIALQDTPAAVKLFGDVILASASIPGLFPPVRIQVKIDGQLYDELHVDGGVTRQVYVAPLNVPYKAFDVFYDRPPERRLFMIQNGKGTPEYDPVTPKTLTITSQSISTLLLSQHKGDIYRIWRMSKDADVQFNMLTVPDSFNVKATQPFDPAYQRALFEEGLRIGRAGGPWLNEPPEFKPGPPTLLDARTRVPVGKSKAEAGAASPALDVFSTLSQH